MTAEAATARASAVHFEAKKDGCTQRQSGDWVIRLTVQSLDLDQAVMRAAPGTRYMVALVEIGDDEQPVQQREEHPASSKTPVPTAPPRQGSPTPRPAGATYAQRLAIAASQPAHWQFLKARLPQSASIDITNEDEAADAQRFLCGGIASRKETVKGTPAGDLARDLLLDYENDLRGVA
jgi:hypothetical protein